MEPGPQTPELEVAAKVRSCLANPNNRRVELGGEFAKPGMTVVKNYIRAMKNAQS